MPAVMSMYFESQSFIPCAITITFGQSVAPHTTVMRVINKTLVKEWHRKSDGFRGSSIPSKAWMMGCSIPGWSKCFLLTWEGIRPRLFAIASPKLWQTRILFPCLFNQKNFVEPMKAAGLDLKTSPASRREKGPRATAKGKWAHEQPTASYRKAKLQHRRARSGRGGSVLCTAPLRARDLAKRDEAQGGQRGTKDTQCFVPDMWYSGSLETFI